MEMSRIKMLMDQMVTCIKQTMMHDQFKSGSIELRFMDGAVAVDKKFQCSTMMDTLLDGAIQKTAPILGALLMLNQVTNVTLYCEKSEDGGFISSHSLEDGQMDGLTPDMPSQDKTDKILQLLDKHGLNLLKSRLDDKVLCYPILAEKYANKPNEEIEWIIKNL